PVVVDAGVADADLHDAEDQRADGRADDRAIAAGEQTASDDRGDDRLELLLQSAIRGRGAGIRNLQDGEERRAQRGDDEQGDLHARNGHAGILGRTGIAANREYPVAGARTSEYE